MDNNLKLEEITGVEIMFHSFLFCYNWTQDDFMIAFKDSRLGWDYYWDRLQGKISNSEIDPAQAILEVVLNMDNEHRQKLFDYLFDQKYAEKISKDRVMRNMIDEAKARASGSNKKL